MALTPWPRYPSSFEYQPFRFCPRSEEYIRLEKHVWSFVTVEWQTIKEISVLARRNRWTISRILTALHKVGLVEWSPTTPVRYRSIRKNGL